MFIPEQYTTFTCVDRGNWLPDSARWDTCVGKIWKCDNSLLLASYAFPKVPGKEFFKLGKGNPTHFHTLSACRSVGFEQLARVDVIVPGGYITKSASEDCEYLPEGGIAIEYIEVSEGCRHKGLASSLLSHVTKLHAANSVLVFPNSQASVNLFSKTFDVPKPAAYAELPVGPCGWSGGKPVRMEFSIDLDIDISL